MTAALALAQFAPTQTRSTRLTPFTLPHFRVWASQLVLDTGQPWVLEPFQEAFVEDLFNGIPEVWLVVAEGSGKSTLISGLALYHCQHKQSALVPVAASSREQAEIIYRQAEGFVVRSPSLRKHFKCLEGYRRIRLDAMNSRIQVFAADDRTGDGVVPTLCLVDELHRHRDLRLYRTWRGKLDKRQGQIVAISTAGEPGGDFELTRERIRTEATDITRSGCFLRAASPGIVLHEWAVPEKGDVENLELVKQANPFSGITVETLRRKRATPTMTLAHWRRFTCNLPTRSDRAAITDAEWAAAETAEEIPEGQPIWLGLDVAWKYDTTAAVPLWIRDPTFRLLGPAKVLTPPRDGTSLDPNLVERALIQIHERNPVHTCVMDTTRAEQLAEWIRSELGANVVDRSQGNQMAALDYERFMEALRNGWLKHGADADLKRHVLNAIARMLPDGRTKFERASQTRQGGDQERRVIDALVAAAMAHTTAAAAIAEGDAAETEPLISWK